jgi:pyridoxamine 5'-phosphate oxidase
VSPRGASADVSGPSWEDEFTSIRSSSERLAKALRRGYSGSLVPGYAVSTTVNHLPVSPPGDPLAIVGEWFDEAIRQAVQRHPNAMALATVDSESRPSARVVLIKNLARTEGYATFYSHYESRKGIELDGNSHAAGVLHWDQLGRQIRLEGRVVRCPGDESDAYFETRPSGSQLNAWVSEQSRPLENMDELKRRTTEKAQDLGLTAERADGRTARNAIHISRPPFWGGYRLWFTAVELWAEGKDRFHERLRYERALTAMDAYSFVTGPWSRQRLQP